VYKKSHDEVDTREVVDALLDSNNNYQGNNNNSNNSNNNIKTDQASTPTIATSGIQLVEMKALP
jgi:hypothetical protein